MAFDNMHEDPARQTPWSNCSFCHDLTGTDVLPSPPSCTNCHQDFTDPNPPPVGHTQVVGHGGFGIDDRLDPMNNCSTCHGGDLTGGFAPSCFTCHEQLWPGGGGNSPPVVDAGGPYAAAPGETVQLDGSGTVDPDDDPLTYLWLVGDGTPPQLPSSNPIKSHVYAAAGTYTVTLTVTDDGGATGTATTTADITAAPNEAPFADHGGPYTGTAGQSVPFNGSASFDTDGTIVSHAWDFGDANVGSGAQPTHTYAAAGTYTVTLTVTDDDGATDEVTTTATITEASSNVPPVADPNGPYTGVVGQPVQLDGTGSSDTDGTIFAYLWNFGDGGVGAGATTSHTYASAGTYTVELAVGDDGGAIGTATTTVEITDASGPGPGPIPGGDAWTVRVPLVEGEFQLTLNQFGGFLFVHEFFPDGMVLTGIGMENRGSILWMDSSGAIFFGGIDRRAGTMHGLVFDYFGRDSIWLAEQPQPPGDCGCSGGGLFGLGLFDFGTAGGSTPTPTPPQSTCGGPPTSQPPIGTQNSCATSSTTMGPRSGFGARSTPRATNRTGSRGTSYRHPRGGMRGGTTRHSQSSSYGRFFPR